MLRRSPISLKKGWTYTPGHLPRGGKNTAFKPKMNEKKLSRFLPLNMEHPRRRPEAWQEREFHRLDMQEWPKAVGFYNAGDNFEITPEMMFRLFQKNKDEGFWSQAHNEKAIIHLLPLVEKHPAENLRKVNEIFQHHVQRFGADHLVYNAAMQASAFARDFARCKALLAEMQTLALEPNAQSYVNMILAVRLCGKRKETAVEYFQEAIRTGAMKSVMRMDTEFEMWWSQLDKMGSFAPEKNPAPATPADAVTAGGFLSVNVEGASPRPKNVWGIWGWDKEERKFVTRRDFVRYEVNKRQNAGGDMAGSVATGYKREPWHKYKGMLKYDFEGPQLHGAHRHNMRVAGGKLPVVEGENGTGKPAGLSY